MKYCLIDNGKVVQVQFSSAPGFISCPDFVVPGFLYDGLVFTPPSPTVIEVDPRLVGIDFQGTMVSATAEDMWGLASVRNWIVAGNDVNFHFENGNVVTLTALNLADFESIWTPFRAGFF